ncbi:hypothetical protein BDQ17DRAFT_464716 [Cyathus striatus]|nr:hypothetical protein BDQ17DRAFT_464716 [Cyathus striatus]
MSFHAAHRAMERHVFPISSPPMTFPAAHRTMEHHAFPTSSPPMTSLAAHRAMEYHVSPEYEARVNVQEYISRNESFVDLAKGALMHATKHKNEISSIFMALNIASRLYTISAGFNERLICEGKGYLEEIHIHINGDVANSVNLRQLLVSLGKIISPFPGAIYIGDSDPIQMPVFKNDGRKWQFNDLVLNRLRNTGSSNTAWESLNSTRLPPQCPSSPSSSENTDDDDEPQQMNISFDMDAHMLKQTSPHEENLGTLSMRVGFTLQVGE